MEATAKTCERIIQDGLIRSNLLISIVKKAENLLTENNKPLPAWVSDTSRADDLSLSLSSLLVQVRTSIHVETHPSANTQVLVLTRQVREVMQADVKLENAVCSTIWHYLSTS